MDALTVPAAVLSFLLSLGCVPTEKVYSVDEIKMDGVSIPGVYDPVDRAVYIRSDVKDVGVLVHELYHSCQPKAQWGSPQSRLNEKEAKGVENSWRDR